MRVYGLDFTSAPTREKPITCAECRFDDGRLELMRFLKFPTFRSFEASLRSRGPWVAAMDFPFGQPRKLVENLGWPCDWEQYVRHVGEMEKEDFEATIRQYTRNRKEGDKHHRRAVDGLSNSRSPMMLDYIPVGKMFFQGAPRLATANVCVLPCRPSPTDRIALEAYPALVARKAIGTMSYKSGARNGDPATRVRCRRQITEWLRSDAVQSCYGASVEFSDTHIEVCLQDDTGDTLDAVLCAVQAAWGYSKRDAAYGIPSSCDALEGWIVDPELT